MERSTFYDRQYDEEMLWMRNVCAQHTHTYKTFETKWKFVYENRCKLNDYA